MFIGHLPAGYVLTKKLQKKLKVKKYLWIGLIGSIFPDFDLFYFYLIDGRQHLHHSYWIHIPFYWLVIGVIILSFFWVIRKKEYLTAALVFLVGIFSHLILDTIVGHVEWFYPFSDQTLYFFDVPAVYDFWVYNFIFHWTFLFEVAVIILAIYTFVRTKIGKSLEGLKED